MKGRRHQLSPSKTAEVQKVPSPVWSEYMGGRSDPAAFDWGVRDNEEVEATSEIIRRRLTMIRSVTGAGAISVVSVVFMMVTSHHLELGSLLYVAEILAIGGLGILGGVLAVRAAFLL